ncbi:MAG: lipid-binding SYLF domain-containing protein [Deltaproteobacteria bacterium]|nr:lipid-binding SYLF domain-containing protein [Deltaproteobacteria bacterium]
MKIKDKIITCMVASLLCLALAAPVAAMSKAEAGLKVEEARISLMQFTSSPDTSTPRWLLARCKGVALFPGMVKAGFIVGGNYGTGVIVSRRPDGSWSGPAFFIMGGASIGLQIGAQSADLFMVIMTKTGLDAVLRNQAKFGVDASAVAGPVGRDAQAAIAGASTQADLYSYSRSAGAFLGASVSGAGIEFDKEASAAYYGRPVTVAEIFDGKVELPPSAKALVEALEKF